MGRGRGGYGGGGRGRGQRRVHHPSGRHGYQKGFIAPPPREVSARAAMLRILNSLGSAPAISPQMSEEEQRAVESFVAHQMLETYGQVMDGINNHPLSITVDSFWDVLLIKPQRVPFFAVLVSLLNRTAVQASEAIIIDAGKRLTASLNFESEADPGTGPSCNHITKAILRLCCALGTLGVISCNSVISRLKEFVDTASDLLKGAADDSKVTTQAYADMLIESVLFALPWGGKTLFEQDKASMEAIFQRLHDYMSARPKQESAELAPWLQLDAETPPTISSDCSGASFLPSLLSSIEELRQHEWLATCVPQPHHYIDNAFNVGAVFDAPTVTFPTAPPAGYTAPQLYPARGICPLLPQHLERAPAGTLAIDVIIAQEYYLHVLYAFASNGKACVDEATLGLPIPFPSVALLVELVISQILLPSPALLVFAYHSILVRLVEVVGQPLALSFGGCIKTLFESLGDLDTILLHRVSDVLAWFVSNNNYQWPWARWERVLEAEPLNAQRRFCSLTLAKMIRLCAQLSYIQQKALPSDNRWLMIIAASDQPTAPPPDPSARHGLQQPFDDLMAALVSKKDEAAMEEQLRSMAAAARGDLSGTLREFLHVLLVRASISQFHTEVLLDRYYGALGRLMASVNGESGEGTAQRIALDTAAKVWRCNSLRVSLTVGRFVSSGLVDVPQVLDWAFAPAGDNTDAASVPKLVDKDEGTATAALECILSLLTTLLNQAQASTDNWKELQMQLPRLQGEAEKAAEEVRGAQQQAQETGTTDEERVQLMDRIQLLTSNESEIAQRLQNCTESLENVQAELEDQQNRGQQALEGLFERCVTSVAQMEDPSKLGNIDESQQELMAQHRDMLMNTFVAFTRHFLSISAGPVNVIGAVKRAIEVRPVPQRLLHVVLRILPDVKVDSTMAEAA